MKKTNITILATYWNEKDWIEASLAQIDAINPREVLICDGCFDTKYENNSTDGTREIIEKWVKERPHASMISALRLSRMQGLWFLFGKVINWWNWPLRIAMALYYSRTNLYRINQAATFTQMLRSIQYNKPGDWIMHSDSDQFYPDAVIERMKEEINDPDSETELLTATEQTFFENFEHYTTEYEKRNYNNLPYRLKKNTMIVPTRDVVSEQYPRPKVYGKDANVKKVSLGSYMHYKFRPFDTSRTDAGYNVGDRKKPMTTKYVQNKFEGDHPKAVTSIVESLKQSKSNS